MTHERDIERLLDHWFADGPTESPDRVNDVVADRIGRQTQRPAWRLDWRHPAMTPTAKLGAAIAAVIVIGLATITMFGGGLGSVGGPAARATPSVNVSPSAGAPTASAATLSCDQGTSGCAGPLAPGVHTATNFKPAFTYTTPAGWVNGVDLATGDFRVAGKGSSPFPEINVWSNVAVPKLTASCPQVRQAGVVDSVQDWKDFLTKNQALATSTPVPVKIGGYDGFSVRFVVAPTWTPPCDPTADAFVEYVVGAPGDGTNWGIARDAHEGEYLTVLDVAGETVVIGVGVTDDPATQSRIIEAAHPVIDSIRFAPVS